MKEKKTNGKTIVNEEITIVKGKTNVIISAPHTFPHYRNGLRKKRDLGTLKIIKLLEGKTNAHLIYINKEINYDPNFTIDNRYQEKLSKYIKENNIEYLIDIHGSKQRKTYDIELGTNYLENLNNDEDLLDNIKKRFKQNKINNVAIDKIFKSQSDTVCTCINKKTNTKAIQIEIGKSYRYYKLKPKKFYRMMESLLDIIIYLERRNKMEQINYEEKYDELLDIKPTYGYERKLSEINYNQVGLEIEVAVNYERNSYTFIKKLLEKIKKLIGENGFFVKDGTILGDYSFEIVLDPLCVDEIYDIYSKLLEIIKFSNGAIEISKEKQCGIHLNFNKKDIESLEIAHKKVTSFVSEHNSLFDENRFKQFKFIWDYNEFTKYQKNIASKYLWINYMKSKVVEIRNIKCNLSAEKLADLLNGLLECLYYDKEINKIDHSTYHSLDKIYNLAFDQDSNSYAFENLKNHEFVIISTKDSKAKVVKLPEEIVNQIKNLI